MLLEKRPTFLEARVTIRRHVELDPKEETQTLRTWSRLSLSAVVPGQACSSSQNTTGHE